jgi:hypothetical protein
MIDRGIIIVRLWQKSERIMSVGSGAGEAVGGADEDASDDGEGESETEEEAGVVPAFELADAGVLVAAGEAVVGGAVAGNGQPGDEEGHPDDGHDDAQAEHHAPAGREAAVVALAIACVVLLVVVVDHDVVVIYDLLAVPRLVAVDLVGAGRTAIVVFGHCLIILPIIFLLLANSF